MYKIRAFQNIKYLKIIDFVRYKLKILLFLTITCL
jgi:hypothetical protein